MTQAYTLNGAGSSGACRPGFWYSITACYQLLFWYLTTAYYELFTILISHKTHNVASSIKLTFLSNLVIIVCACSRHCCNLYRLYSLCCWNIFNWRHQVGMLGRLNEVHSTALTAVVSAPYAATQKHTQAVFHSRAAGNLCLCQLYINIHTLMIYDALISRVKDMK